MLYSAYKKVEIDLKFEQWYHIAVVFFGQSNTVGIYLNGHLKLENTITPSEGTSLKIPLDMTDIRLLSGYQMNGNVACIRVYNRALNQGTIGKLLGEQCDM